MDFDFAIVRFCNELGRGRIDGVCLFLCDTRFLIALWTSLAFVAAYFDKTRGRTVLATVVLAAAIHFVVSEGILKHLLTLFFPERVRPYLAHPGVIVPVGTEYHDSSFPSSHNSSTAAIVTGFVYYYRRLVPVGALLVLAMAFSRMHNGMHYPTDVLAGITLGVGYGALAIVVVRRLQARMGPRTC